jgi:hypothetical protein
MGADFDRSLEMHFRKYSEHRYKIGAKISKFRAKRKGIETFIRPTGWVSDMMCGIYWVVYEKERIF